MIRQISFLAFLSILVLGVSCGEDESGTEVSVEAQKALLANLGDNMIIPAYSNLDSKVNALTTAVDGFDKELNLENLMALQASLKESRIAWQKCNFLDFGPASEVGLAATLNIFPVDRGDIERNVSDGNYDLAVLEAADERGFAALGYLIHGKNNSSDEVLAQFQQSEERRAYLKDLVSQIAEKVKSVNEKWSVSGGNYLTTFKESTGTNVGSSLGVLVNAVTQSLERKTRDGKIGIPVGLRTLGVAIPGSVEAFYGGYSTELAVANLKAYQNLFKGSEQNVLSNGFLDYLLLLDNQQLAGDIENAFVASINSVSVLKEPFQLEVEQNPTPTNTAIADLQGLILLIKSEMTSVMGISITFQDNDGD